MSLRETTATIDEQLAADGASWAFAYRLTLPLMPGDLAPVEIRVAEFLVDTGVEVYLPLIEDRGGVGQSEGAATDSVTLSLMNHDETFGHTLTEDDRSLDGATCDVRIFFLTEAGLEVTEVCSYVVDDVKVNSDKKTVELSLVPDTMRPNAKVGGEQASQRCLYKFNAGGLVQIETDGRTYGTVGRFCAWSLAQGGNPASCDHTATGGNGCIAHGNLYHISAVPEPTDEMLRQAGVIDAGGRPIVIPGGGTIGGGGTGGGYIDPNDPDRRFRPRVPFSDIPL